MNQIDLIMHRRAEWQKAKGRLKALLEYFPDMECFERKGAFNEMKKGIDDFIEWVEQKSPIA